MKISKASVFIILCIAVASFNLATIQGQTKSQGPAPGYAEASYAGISDNEFLKNWLIVGPVKISSHEEIPDDTKQKEAFEKDLLTSVMVQPKKALTSLMIGDKSYSWKTVKCADGIVDFVNLIGPFNYSVAYALAEIKMDAPAKILVGLGSDDGIKLFVNGTLVHSNWVARSTTPDEDLVMLELKKGSNQILVKVQNMEGGWSFALRKPGKDILGKMLIESSRMGNLDNVKLLIDNGVDVNAKNDVGLTAYQISMIRGNRAMQYLKEHGAGTDIPMPSFDILVDNIFKSAQTGTTSGVSILVSKNGEIIYEKGFGYADIGNKVPVTPETKFRIGSITKQFIAASVLKLQEEGKINVQDKLSKFIPDFPRGDEVTIHHLLTHTSGIHSYTNRPDFLNYVTLPVTPAALVDTIKAYPYDFNPGDNYMYNNSGFFLLGYIIEKISGKSLADYLQETLFSPLGMNNTGIYETTLLLDHEAYGYSYENGKITKALNWDMSWAGGAGALYSTVKDLYTWNEAVFNGKVLSEESLKAAFTPAKLNSGKTTDYGYGWAIQDYRGYKFIQHGGGLHGFTTYLERQPDRKVTVVVLCNSVPPPDGINPGSNASLISEYMLWPEMTKQSGTAAETSVDNAVLESYVGRYDYGQGMVLMVTMEGNQLYAQLTGQSRFPIFPSSSNEFYWKVVEASVKFVTDEKGNVTHAIHNQNGRQFDAGRLTDETPVAVNPAVFDQYVGKYDAGSNNIMIISKEGDKLFIQAPNLPKYQLLPASETEYFLKEANARLKFKVSAEGTADSIIIIINGIETTAKKL